MLTPLTVLLIDLAYILVLFLAAMWVERKDGPGRRLADSPVVYSLSLAVFCTSWTFYGSVGLAASSGLLYLATFIGPTLIILLWPTIMGKIIRIKNVFRITSIADFISARYDKSQSIGALAALAALIGTMPYIALQIKSINTTFKVITAPVGPGGVWITNNIGLVTIILMTFFTIAFGVRKLDPTERHRGMIAAVALESMVKLLALISVGVFVTFMVRGGAADFVDNPEFQKLLTLNGPGGNDYVLWFTYLVMAMAAVMFLPRQFHVAVVENSHEKHLKTAIWLFPLYLFLMNLFVVPLAFRGMEFGLPPGQADTYVLRLPFEYGRPALALFVFIGGFSAAMSMVMITAMTMSTMMVNHLLMPLIHMVPGLGIFRRNLLRCRWAAVALVIGIGYWFERQVGESYMLVNMGLISFAAAIQFAPAIIGGLFWKEAGKIGAALGLGGGFGVWLYTLLLPSLVKSGWMSPAFLDGPFGIRFLRPESLFGLTALQGLPHSIFWSLLFNVALFVLGSLLVRQSGSEQSLAREFADVSVPRPYASAAGLKGDVVGLEERIGRIRELIGQYLPNDEVESVIDRSLEGCGVKGEKTISLLKLADLRNQVEKGLAGSVGSATAHRVLNVGSIISARETEKLSRYYAGILADLKLSPEELRRRVDFYQEREALITEHASELEKVVEIRTRDLAQKARELEDANKRLLEMDKMKSAFFSSVSHELRTPLTSVLGFAKIIRKDFHKVAKFLVDPKNQVKERIGRIGRNLEIITQEGLRLTRLINDVLDLNRIEDGRQQWRDAEFTLPGLVRRAVDAVAPLFAAKPSVSLEIELEPELPAVYADRDQLLQVMINLLNNAVKFTNAGRIGIEVGRSGDGGVSIIVSDTGVGIAPDDIERIFSKFYQVAHGDTLGDKPKGTGLGLVICREIASHYNGRIWVESVLGRGSRFHVDLPPEIVMDVIWKGGTGEGEILGIILLAFKDARMCSGLAEFLEQEGYKVFRAMDGVSALSMARRRSPDMIAMDVGLRMGDEELTMARMVDDADVGAIPVALVSPDKGGVDPERLGDGLAQAAAMILKGYSEPCPRTIVLRRSPEESFKPPLGVCPEKLESRTSAEVTEMVERGFEGIVLAPSAMFREIDLLGLAAHKGILLLVMPMVEEL